jgi:hypothetical protein
VAVAVVVPVLLPPAPVVVDVEPAVVVELLPPPVVALLQAARTATARSEKSAIERKVRGRMGGSLHQNRRHRP